MNSITRDPLLAIAKGILWFLMGAMLLGVVSCIVALPLIHLYQHEIAVEFAKSAPEVPITGFVWAVTLVLACCIGLLLVLFRMFQLLKRIVDTVGQGDPFVPENAGRLIQMAWLSLAMQVVTIPIGTAATWIALQFKEAPGVHTNIDTLDFGFSSNGLLLMLILFILARVFRQGAAMRAELEGMV